MGIHDMGYRTFKGQVGGRLERIWAIFIQEFFFRIKQRWTIVILVLSLALGLFPAVLFTYVMISFAIAAGEGAPIEIFNLYFTLIFMWVVIFTTVVGSPIISNDLRNNSIILFFARPMTKEDYFFGKLLTLFVMISLVTFLPALLMSITILGLATEELNKYMDIFKVVGSLIGISLLMSFVFSSISLLLSSMTKNYLYAGVGIFSVLLFSNIIGPIFSELIHDDFSLLSIWYNLLVIADDGAGFNTITDFAWYNSLGILFGVSFICLAGAWRIIRKVEVI